MAAVSLAIDCDRFLMAEDATGYLQHASLLPETDVLAVPRRSRNMQIGGI